MEGAKYGLELNWSKTYQMNICSNIQIYCPDGARLEVVRTFVYLGGLIACDGRCEGALNRKVGEGRGLFKSLCQIWSHASISQHRKIEIFNACVASKFLYSLESLWMLKADRSRIDSFQCRCLRQIAKIPHSFISRISNEEVFARTCQKRFSSILCNRCICKNA